MSSLDAVPQLGPNKIQEALDDYQHMENERDVLKRDLEIQTDLTVKVMAENDAIKNQIKEQAAFYGQEIAAINIRNRRLERLLSAIITRFKGIKESVEAAEVEAMMESVGTEGAKATAITEAAIAAAAEMAPIAKPPKRKPRALPETSTEDELALQALALHDPARRAEVEGLPLNLYRDG